MTRNGIRMILAGRFGFCAPTASLQLYFTSLPLKEGGPPEGIFSLYITAEDTRILQHKSSKTSEHYITIEYGYNEMSHKCAPSFFCYRFRESGFTHQFCSPQPAGLGCTTARMRGRRAWCNLAHLQQKTTWHDKSHLSEVTHLPSPQHTPLSLNQNSGLQGNRYRLVVSLKPGLYLR